jgi:alanine-alpha-ketoisovalerate/valine-pyruvate aminotransferase
LSPVSTQRAYASYANARARSVCVCPLVSFTGAPSSFAHWHACIRRRAADFARGARERC